MPPRSSPSTIAHVRDRTRVTASTTIVTAAAASTSVKTQVTSSPNENAAPGLRVR